MASYIIKNTCDFKLVHIYRRLRENGRKIGELFTILLELDKISRKVKIKF